MSLPVSSEWGANQGRDSVSTKSWSGLGSHMMHSATMFQIKQNSNFTPGRLMKTTAVVFIRQGDRQRYRNSPHWFMWEVVIFKSSEFAYIQIMTPRVRNQRHGRIRWIFIEKLVIEISRWWRPLETGMKTTDCVAWDLMKTTVVD